GRDLGLSSAATAEPRRPPDRQFRPARRRAGGALGMSGWGRKVFWKEVGVTEGPEGFAITLDGRPIKTPAKAPLLLPTRALADMVAAEWAAQDDQVKPETMSATRAANAALDKVRGQFAEVAALLTAYGETDLLCYRAEGPAEIGRASCRERV